ncbi:hypothetical protein NA57DRAFT_50267 [Rhizodiscina lignyota]|uniref:3-hydroxyacyl-CoA dehydrogenase n=1 Tax=Rhizodiscina lignyota TaxID=1504668 RepID=A0A9P4I5H4_9PEZI|nr:hypothetical protein NA57DRAFT_50267 [Rhizodiscina lignyota]
MASAIKTVGVLGTGVIGSSWTTLFLSRGLKVIVSDPAPGAQQHLDDFIKRAWPSMQRIGLSADASPSNYKFVDDLANHLDDVDFVQENAPEKKEFKSKLFGNLDAKAKPGLILASSSSGIPSSQFVDGCTKAPERVLIGHPFNPPHLIPLVEVVPHPGTAKEVTETAIDFYRSLGKHPILIKQEVPGFVANRLQAVLGNEGNALVERGIVSAEDLDTAVTSSLGMRWAVTGPVMTNILGGGGGKDGFMRIQKSIGRSAQVWLKDMAEHPFTPTDESLEKVNDSVLQWIEHLELATVEEERDNVVLTIMDLKKQYVSIHQ